MKLGKQECSSVKMSWDEANKYCKNKGRELFMVKSIPCNRDNSGGRGEWLGLRLRWMYKSAIQKNGKYNMNTYVYQFIIINKYCPKSFIFFEKQWKNKLVKIIGLVKQVNFIF